MLCCSFLTGSDGLQNKTFLNTKSRHRQLATTAKDTCPANNTPSPSPLHCSTETSPPACAQTLPCPPHWWYFSTSRLVMDLMRGPCQYALSQRSSLRQTPKDPGLLRPCPVSQLHNLAQSPCKACAGCQQGDVQAPPPPGAVHAGKRGSLTPHPHRHTLAVTNTAPWFGRC